MALRVWLPLLGNFKNHGAANIPAISLVSGNSWASSGKIGGQSLQITKQQSILGTSSCMTGKKQMSYAFWVKVNTAWSAQWLDGIAWYSTDGSNAAYSRQEFYTNCTRVGTWFSGSSLSGYVFTPGEWTHLAGTFDYTAGVAKFYINGVLQGTSTALSKTHSCRGDFYIGDSGIDIVENDVRIYDHCLSQAEIKELAQGLILHYPLNRGGLGQENLFNWSNNATGITLNDYQNVGSFTQFTNSLSFDPSTTVGKKYTISFWAKSPNGTTSLLLYNSNSKPKYFNFSTTLTSNLGTEWQFFKYTVTNTQYTGSDASTNTNIWKRIEIYAPNKMKVQVKQIKVEEGEVATPWCPNSSDALATTIGLNSTIEYDCSGFCNNGTRTGTFTWTSNTPKYAVSTEFIKGSKINASTGMITTPNPIFTCNFWVNTPTGTYTQYSDIVTFGGSAQFRMEVSNTAGTQLSWFNYPIGTSNGIGTNGAVSNNTWNMFTITCDGTNWKTYKNGVLATTTAISGTTWTPDGTISLGDSGTLMKMSDFRIYATALSADDIKSLYQNEAFIDSSGVVYGQIR